MILSLVVAKAHDGVIGLKNTMPWHLPEDLQHFKRVTMGKPVIMGRKTFESIGRPLQGRENIVITRDPAYLWEGVRVVSSVAEAVLLASTLCNSRPDAEIMVIGGQQIFEQALPMADRIYMTELDVALDGDTFFPAINPHHWSVAECNSHQPTKKVPFAYSFIVLERKAGKG